MHSEQVLLAAKDNWYLPPSVPCLPSKRLLESAAIKKLSHLLGQLFFIAKNQYFIN